MHWRIKQEKKDSTSKLKCAIMAHFIEELYVFSLSVPVFYRNNYNGVILYLNENHDANELTREEKGSWCIAWLLKFAVKLL